MDETPAIELDDELGCPRCGSPKPRGECICRYNDDNQGDDRELSGNDRTGGGYDGQVWSTE